MNITFSTYLFEKIGFDIQVILFQFESEMVYFK